MVEGKVGPDGKIADCKLISEEPAGLGFGEAGLNMCSTFRMRPKEGQTADDAGVVRIPIRFLPQPEGPCFVNEPDIAPGFVAAKVKACPEPGYPAEARDAGHQGEVEVAGTLRTDGSLGDLSVTTSSKSPLLDQAALEAFGRWTFGPALDGAGKPREARVSRRFAFAKDSVVGLDQKTCAEFVTDVRWFEGNWPGRPRREMRLYTLSLGLITIIAMQKSTEGALALARNYPQAFDRTVERCAAKPKAKFLETLIKAL
jgi:protein TonB